MKLTLFIYLCFLSCFAVAQTTIDLVNFTGTITVQTCSLQANGGSFTMTGMRSDYVDINENDTGAIVLLEVLNGTNWQDSGVIDILDSTGAKFAEYSLNSKMLKKTGLLTGTGTIDYRISDGSNVSQNTFTFVIN